MAASRLHGDNSLPLKRSSVLTEHQTAQTALIGSLASVGVNDRVQAIVTIIVLAITITPPQLLS